VDGNLFGHGCLCCYLVAFFQAGEVEHLQN
jgi:hypothetical protein